jgi:HTH-type transcriptional regulator, transcriptional repressor of NAD biosynthesis genes
MQRFGKGLVVGKFWPLHQGHQYLIDRALACCEEVIVISYTKPEHPRFGPQLRDCWLALLCPAVTRLVVDDATLNRLCCTAGIDTRSLPRNDADDAAHRDFVGWLCDAVLGKCVDAVFTSEGYGDGLAAALALRFGRPVQHVCVDRARQAVPVSGSLIRSDLQRYRLFLDPRVYADVVPRVGVLGGESSGKTTLCRALAQRLSTVWAAEYGRELWEHQGGQLGLCDMVKIARTQILREENLAQQARGWLVCDTTPLTTRFYSEEMFGTVDPLLMGWADRHYDLIVLCEPDFEFVQDGTRRGESFRRLQHDWYVKALSKRGLPFVIARGSVQERLRTVHAAILCHDRPLALPMATSS